MQYPNDLTKQYTNQTEEIPNLIPSPKGFTDQMASEMILSMAPEIVFENMVSQLTKDKNV